MSRGSAHADPRDEPLRGRIKFASLQSATKDLEVKDLRHASVREQKKFIRFQDQLREHPDYDILALDEGMPIAITLTLSDKKGNVKGLRAHIGTYPVPMEWGD